MSERMVNMLFTPQNVVATRECRKIVTRRMNNKIPYDMQLTGWNGEVAEFRRLDGVFRPPVHVRPRYKAGDTIRVREPWATENGVIIYKADDPQRSKRWLPGLRMRKEYARMFLSVHNVQPVRLMDVDDLEAKDEGFHDREAYLQYWYELHGVVEDRWIWRIVYSLLKVDGVEVLRTPEYMGRVQAASRWHPPKRPKYRWVADA